MAALGLNQGGGKVGRMGRGRVKLGKEGVCEEEGGGGWRKC